MSKSRTKTPKKVTDSPDHKTKVLAILTKVDSQRLKPEAAVTEIEKIFAELYAPVITPVINTLIEGFRTLIQMYPELIDSSSPESQLKHCGTCDNWAGAVYQCMSEIDEEVGYFDCGCMGKLYKPVASGERIEDAEPA